MRKFLWSFILISTLGCSRNHSYELAILPGLQSAENKRLTLKKTKSGKVSIIDSKNRSLTTELSFIELQKLINIHSEEKLTLEKPDQQSFILKDNSTKKEVYVLGNTALYNQLNRLIESLENK